MKQAKIKCPHCGKPITVRQAAPSASEIEKVWAAMDEMFEMMDAQMRKLFGRSKSK